MEPAPLRVILARAPGLLARHVFACLPDGRACGALPSDLLTRLLDGPLPIQARTWLSRPDRHLIDSDLRWIGENAAQIVCCVDPDFPRNLADWSASPATLYVRGSAAALRTTLCGVVGSRHATPAGLATVEHFATELARAGVSMLSGLEEGVDTAAHEGALAAGAATIGLCVTGLDRVHPAGSTRLMAGIPASGALVSAFPPGRPALRHHFPIRSRLLAALSSGVLVIEATMAGSAQTSVEQARALGRRVFAIPGSIRDPAARGCNQLIRGRDARYAAVRDTAGS